MTSIEPSCAPYDYTPLDHGLDLHIADKVVLHAAQQPIITYVLLPSNTPSHLQ